MSLRVICGLAFLPNQKSWLFFCTSSMLFLNFNHSLLKNNQSLSHLNCVCAIALKIAKILAAEASAQPFKNNYGASTIASKIVAPLACSTIIVVKVPTSAYRNEVLRALIDHEKKDQRKCF